MFNNTNVLRLNHAGRSLHVACALIVAILAMEQVRAQAVELMVSRLLGLTCQGHATAQLTNGP